MKKILALAFPALMLVGVAFGLGVLYVAVNADANPSNGPGMRLASNPILAATGKDLFVAKGCVVCHRQDAGRSEAIEALGNEPNLGEFVSFIGQAGPDLDNLKADPAFLRRWLKDPSAVKPGTAMPTLNLSDDEIDALIAFLNNKP